VIFNRYLLVSLAIALVTGFILISCGGGSDRITASPQPSIPPPVPPPPNSAPVAHFNVPHSADSGTSVEFDGSASTDRDGKIVSYLWHFGDGDSAEGMNVKHRFASARNYGVMLTVIDDRDGKDTLVKKLEVEEGKGSGHTAGACSANDFRANSFLVVDVTGNLITSNLAMKDCTRLCGEIRRKAHGLREFIGDLVDINGTLIRFNPKRLPADSRPRQGERLFLVWKSCSHK